jgi:hypothetical protein
MFFQYLQISEMPSNYVVAHKKCLAQKSKPFTIQNDLLYWIGQD